MTKKKDIPFIEAKQKQYNKKPTTTIQVTDGKGKIEMQNAKTYKDTKALHKAEIKKLRGDIHKHKLLIKQAKIVFKLSK